MDVYLAIGSNLDDRKKNMARAISLLGQTEDVRVCDVSPVYETPAALLYATAEDGDNKPYLNCSVKIQTNKDALILLRDLKNVEKTLGRDFSRRWSPRPIDLDIIFYGNEHIDTPRLTVPHKLYKKRSFVLDALSWFKKIPAENLYVPTHQPLIAGILNVTPDSFSDGGVNNSPETFFETFKFWEKAGVPIVDIGAESTRPAGEKISAAEELKRLAFVFDGLKSLKKDVFFPKLSIDTYHVETAAKAFENGFDVLNDVDGLDAPEMTELAQTYKNKRFVFMHHDDIRDLPFDKTVEAVEKWLDGKMNRFAKIGLNEAHLFFDVGIGFGKTATQSLCLLQNLPIFHKYGIKLAVGHSRKSFMNVFTREPFALRDVETTALSVRMMPDTDMIRVHAPVEHCRALTAVSHMNNQFFYAEAL